MNPNTIDTMTSPKNNDAMNAAAALTGLSGTPEQQQQQQQPVVEQPNDGNTGSKKESTNSLEVTKTFPQMLMEILSDPANEDCIQWLPHGCSFRIHNRTRFLDEVLPRYYNNKRIKYTSFTRKLSRWDFVRLSSGPDTGAFYHKLFQRDNPKLARKMFCKGERPQFVRTIGGMGGVQMGLPGTFGGIGWNTALGLAGQQGAGTTIPGMGPTTTTSAGSGLEDVSGSGSGASSSNINIPSTTSSSSIPNMEAFLANMSRNPSLKANILAQQQLLQEQQRILQSQLAASASAASDAGGLGGLSSSQQEQQQQNDISMPGDMGLQQHHGGSVDLMASMQQQQHQQDQQQEQPPQDHQQQQQGQQDMHSQQQQQQPQDHQQQLQQMQQQMQQQMSAQQMAMVSPQDFLNSQKLDLSNHGSGVGNQQQQFMTVGRQDSSQAVADDSTAPSGAKRAWAA